MPKPDILVMYVRKLSGKRLKRYSALLLEGRSVEYADAWKAEMETRAICKGYVDIEFRLEHRLIDRRK